MNPSAPDLPPRRGAGRKLAVVAAIVAFTTGLSGYFMGLLQTERAARARAESRLHPVASAPARHETPDTTTPPPEAPEYLQLREHTQQPNHSWSSRLATLTPAPAYTAATPRLAPAEIAALETRRAQRRAFNGAPPTVPHPIDQRQSGSCLACHGQPTRVGLIAVPQLSHPPFTHCIQCHAPAGGPGLALRPPPPALATPMLANTFVAYSAPARGTRAHAAAPPTIPHSSAMRQNCLSCHGAGGSSLLKPTHPERQNCLQCHALDAQRETHPPALPPSPSLATVSSP